MVHSIWIICEISTPLCNHPHTLMEADQEITVLHSMSPPPFIMIFPLSLFDERSESILLQERRGFSPSLSHGRLKNQA